MTAKEANERLVGENTTAGESGRLTAALESANATGEALRNKTLETAKASDHVIRQHPYESIGIAFGAGLLIGVLVGRR